MSTTQTSPRSYVDLGDYRAQVATLYSAVRESEQPPSDTWSTWCEGRRALLAGHPQSVFVESSMPPAPFWKYSDHWRTTGKVVEADVEDLLLEESEGSIRRFNGVGNVVFAPGDADHELPIYWADAYGGGWLLPFRDSTNGTFTYGSGRYLLDGVKGADLGLTPTGELLLDFNYAYHPSCVWGNWICPLPSQRAQLQVAVTAGESKPEIDETRHGYRCERFRCGAFIVDGAEHDCC